MFWVSVFGTVLASSFDQSNTSQFLVVGLGILFGILIHDLGLMALVATTRKANESNRHQVGHDQCWCGLDRFFFLFPV